MTEDVGAIIGRIEKHLRRGSFEKSTTPGNNKRQRGLAVVNRPDCEEEEPGGEQSNTSLTSDAFITGTHFYHEFRVQ